MDDVQLKLAHERVSKNTRLPFCHLDADKNFAVVKCKDVSWPSLAEKLAVQSRHSTIGNEPDEDIPQSHQFRLLLAPNFYATAYCALRELLQIANLYGHNSLKIANADPR
jgi:hypothetical protein